MNIYKILSSKPHNPHYLNRYIKFIEYCKVNNENKDLDYTEEHHICPKANEMFPEFLLFSEYPWNKVELTSRQHFIAHYILWKCYRNKSAARAFNMMAKCPNQYRMKYHYRGKLSSREYEILKEETNTRGENNPSYGKPSKFKGIKRGPNPKISKAKIGKKRKPFSEEWIENLSKSHKGKSSGEKNGMYGKGHLISGKKHGMYGRGDLISGMKHGMADRTLYYLYNTETNEYFTGFRQEFIKANPDIPRGAVGKLVKGSGVYKKWINLKIHVSEK